MELLINDMEVIKIDLTGATPFVSANLLASEYSNAIDALTVLSKGTGLGSDYLGWLYLPQNTSSEDVKQIKEVARDISHNIDILVVIGIGGSYLGTKAVIEALSHSFDTLMPNRTHPLLLFAGHNIDEDYMCELLELIHHRSCACIVISKSGTTTEPAIAFRLIKKHIEEKYGKEDAKRRIVTITDSYKGALRAVTIKEGYRSFVIPDNVGGRFSVLTPVGLLPIAIAGIDIETLMEGARMLMKQCLTPIKNNPAVHYAAIRNALFKSGKTIELLANFHPKLHFLAEWWKQLYGESEGKEGKGIFPAGVDFTTDLHSLGQYIQEGPRMIMETVLSVSKPERLVLIENEEDNFDGLNYLTGRRMSECNHKAELGTRMAHIDGGVPNVRIEIPRLDAFCIGAILYFFEVACGISGYMLGVNPFDQPGVEAYKRNMFRLLGKETQ